ncbi:MAG: hypothetical protein CI948_2463, partial [Halanaerobium sp.]
LGEIRRFTQKRAQELSNFIVDLL